jgi:N-acetylneuraminic acid mutarotase
MKTTFRTGNKAALLFVSVALFIAGGAATVLGFGSTGSLTTGRTLHTTTLLQNGKVLVAGGSNGSPLATAELYDPSVGTWVAASSLLTARQAHTATILTNGKVLVTGGISTGNNNVLFSAELYDPGKGNWTATGNLTNSRYAHTTTLLPNGKVLVAGGINLSGFHNSAELYDPATGKWTVTGNLNTARGNHTATLLSSGQVLVAGGQGFVSPNTGTLQSSELYDPATGSWTATTGNLGTPRYNHTATLLSNHKVLVVGGQNSSGTGAIGSAELYDPATNSWNTTPSPTNNRYSHTATLLPDGTVMVAGGFDGTNDLTSAEIYDPLTGPNGTWFAGGSLAFGRASHTATLLPNGAVLFAAGFNGAARITSDKYLKSAELYNFSGVGLKPAGSMGISRASHTATLLPNGSVLVAGGENVSGTLPYAEICSPSGQSWSGTDNLAGPRRNHTATLLANGNVLVAAGINAGGLPLPSAELYEPVAGTWTGTGSLTNERYNLTATLLQNGKVLVAGGFNIRDRLLASAEIYDPASRIWTATGNLITARGSHTATLLANGKVLIAGGNTDAGVLPTAELYDPTSGMWTGTTGNLITARDNHTATLLPNGKVLIAGGEGAGGALANAELFDPASNTWTATANLGTARYSHTATLLRDGTVLVAGGAGTNGKSLTSAEVFDPASGLWTSAPNLATAREGHTATLLLNGQVLLTGGANSQTTTSAELYVIVDFSQPAWQPQIATVSTLTLGSSLSLTGSRFQGISQASGGDTQDSSTNYPIVQLRSIGNEQSSFLLPANWSPTAFTSKSVGGFPLGPALVTVFANGIPSDAKYLVVALPTPTFTTQASAGVNSGGSISDTATLSGGSAPSGTITFNLYGPNDSSCGSAPVFTATVPISGAGSYSSGSFVVTTPGTYRWVAIYSGDANNGEVATACSDANESVVVTPSPTPTASPTATPTSTAAPAPGSLGNVSTRLQVGTGNNVLFAGFIIQGNASKTVLIRSAGPSLASFGVPGVLGNPQLELHDTSNTIGTNDNWQTTQLGGVITSDQVAAIQNSGAAPADPAEPAIIATLPAGGYTAIVQGVSGTQGVATVEVYDLSPNNGATLANISTRGFIQTGDSVMIGGFIVVGNSSKVLIRATGPSLIPFGINNTLANPQLDLHDANGTLAGNDDWQTTQLGGIITSDQSTAIQNSGLAPGNPAESAIIATLAPGAYTAIAQGVNGGTGVGLVEVFALP